MTPVPDIRQRTSHDCGPAAVAVVRAYHGLPAKPWLKSDATDGTCPRAIEAELRSAGMGVAAGEMCIDDLRHYGKTGRPVIAIVRNHYVVVQGVHRGRVYYQDPEHGPQSVRESEWSEWWRDNDRMGTEYLQWGIVAWGME